MTSMGLKRVECDAVSSFIHRNWWVALCLVFSLLLYVNGMQKKRSMMRTLNMRCDDLEEERSAALERNRNLQQQIESQNDPAWVEITLMRELGLVPEGKTKVYFSSE